MLLLLAALTLAADVPLLGPDAVPLPQVVATEGLFAPADAPGGVVRTDPRDLLRVAESTADYLWRHDVAGDPAPHGLRDALGIDPQRVRDTLDFVAAIAREDAHRPGSRLQDPDFLARHFTVLHWSGDADSAGEHGIVVRDGQVRLTRYLVYQHQGSPVRTAVYDTPLHAIPTDEATLTLDEAEGQPDLLRHRYTRRQVLDGVFLDGGEAAGQAPVLAWMRRADIHEALMQGTVELSLTDGTVRTFNVHRSNNIPYQRAVRNPEAQDRFWYFREVDGVRGWGEGSDKIALAPQAAVAGDVDNLGLGGLFAIAGGDGLRLVVLADTGGAFQPNLYQLDLFTGAFPDRATFAAETAGVPDRAQVYLLVLRDVD